MPNGPVEQRSDEVLARLAQLGCAASFEVLVGRYQTRLLHFLRRLGAGADAEDVLQEAYLRAFENLAHYRCDSRFSAWLYTIARRVWINHYHRAKPAAGAQVLASVASPVAGPWEQAAAEDERRHFWGMAAKALSQEEFTAVWLFYVEDLSGKEIARVLERSWVSVKTMLFRARRRLLALFDEMESNGAADEAIPRQPRRASKVVKAEVPHV